jgi:hypothetical protein
LVLDATTGQNGLRQARIFAEVVDVTGIVLTKLDGSAKGGIVVQVQRESACRSSWWGWAKEQTILLRSTRRSLSMRYWSLLRNSICGPVLSPGVPVHGII